ncbi:hypothetical protein BJ741DRAFT_583882 [Chytriomyces cf. hyalinus JEL632]|nr:hypothetical protein BJ741DRAFT_583882 [Chytriomyces cf. hyalinus JEL632]
MCLCVTVWLGTSHQTSATLAQADKGIEAAVSPTVPLAEDSRSIRENLLCLGVQVRDWTDWKVACHGASGSWHNARRPSQHSAAPGKADEGDEATCLSINSALKESMGQSKQACVEGNAFIQHNNAWDDVLRGLRAWRLGWYAIWDERGDILRPELGLSNARLKMRAFNLSEYCSTNKLGCVSSPRKSDVGCRVHVGWREQAASNIGCYELNLQHLAWEAVFSGNAMTTRHLFGVSASLRTIVQELNVEHNGPSPVLRDTYLNPPHQRRNFEIGAPSISSSFEQNPSIPAFSDVVNRVINPPDSSGSEATFQPFKELHYDEQFSWHSCTLNPIRDIQSIGTGSNQAWMQQNPRVRRNGFVPAFRNDEEQLVKSQARSYIVSHRFGFFEINRDSESSVSPRPFQCLSIGFVDIGRESDSPSVHALTSVSFMFGDVKSSGKRRMWYDLD